MECHFGIRIARRGWQSQKCLQECSVKIQDGKKV